MDSPPGIVPILTGGLGNQMFMVAAAYVAAHHANCPLYIVDCEPDNTHNKLSYDYNQLIFKDFGQVQELDLDQYTPFTQISEEGWHPCYDPWDPAEVQPGSKMISNFQYYPPIKPYEEEIRAKFLKALEPFVPPLDYSGAAFVHIRRGDYLDNPLYHFIQTLDYYKDAVKRLRKASPQKIFILSDDMEWVASQAFFRQPIFEPFQGDELQTLALMSKCVKGAICGNSTFSWWGAFLGAHALRAPVYVPSDWIDIPVASLFPEEWIVVPSGP